MNPLLEVVGNPRVSSMDRASPRRRRARAIAPDSSLVRSPALVGVAIAGRTTRKGLRVVASALSRETNNTRGTLSREAALELCVAEGQGRGEFDPAWPYLPLQGADIGFLPAREARPCCLPLLLSYCFRGGPTPTKSDRAGIALPSIRARLPAATFSGDNDRTRAPNTATAFEPGAATDEVTSAQSGAYAS